MKNLLFKKAVLVGLLAGFWLPQMVTCDVPGLDGWYDGYGYYDEYYYEDVYVYDEYVYDDCCYVDDGWGFDLWFDGWW